MVSVIEPHLLVNIYHFLMSTTTTTTEAVGQQVLTGKNRSSKSQQLLAKLNLNN